MDPMGNNRASKFCDVFSIAPTLPIFGSTFKASKFVSWTDCAKDMRKVVVHHMEGGHNILSFVESRGVEALSKLHGFHFGKGEFFHLKKSLLNKGLQNIEKHTVYIYINHQF